MRSEMTVRELLAFCRTRKYFFSAHWITKRVEELKREAQAQAPESTVAAKA